MVATFLDKVYKMQQVAFQGHCFSSFALIILAVVDMKTYGNEISFIELGRSVNTTGYSLIVKRASKFIQKHTIRGAQNKETSSEKISLAWFSQQSSTKIPQYSLLDLQRLIDKNETEVLVTTVEPYLEENVTVSAIPERRVDRNSSRKSQKTESPMLNYIFDSFSAVNKHHHHDQRYGPHFEGKFSANNSINLTVQAGSVIYLDCRISLLQDKTVSWVKRSNNSSEDVLELLTVGLHTYSGDSRYRIEFQYPNNWRLKIASATKSDEGVYECQISTHPPKIIQINLHVNAPSIVIVDACGAQLQEMYYETDSTLELLCIVRNIVMSSSAVFWSHGEKILNYDITRGGVSVKTELMEDGANSTLYIAKVKKSDSGKYSCSINSSHEYAINVHVLNGKLYTHSTTCNVCQNKLKEMLRR